MDTAASATAGQPAPDRLPALFWNSWDVERAVADGSPGAVIALARQAHGLSQGELGALAGFSQSAISRLETGGNLAFDIRVLRSLARLLGIPLRLLGLAEEPGPLRPAVDFGFPGSQRLAELSGQRVPVLPIDHKSLLNAYVSAVFGGATVAAATTDVDDHALDPGIAGRLMVVRRLVNEADSGLGPANVAPAAGGLYRLIERMHRAARGAMRRKLLDVAASYAEFYGWLCEEIGDLHGAVVWTERSLRQAQAADHPELVAYSYVRLAQLAETQHDDEKMIGMSRAAQREDGLSPQVRAMAVQQEARGHALAGDTTACLRKLDEARNLPVPESAQWGDEYRVGCYFDVPHLLVNHAANLLEAGRAKDAIASYRENHGGEFLCRWQQAVHAAKLSRAYAICGDVDQAAKVGERAVELGDGLGSALVEHELGKLDDRREPRPQFERAVR
jgi:transcriptional regulator with XRE-family HTH domain